MESVETKTVLENQHYNGKMISGTEIILKEYYSTGCGWNVKNLAGNLHCAMFICGHLVQVFKWTF